MSNWDVLHDATIHDILVRWDVGTVELILVLSSETPRNARVIALKMTRLNLPRYNPWGPSVSINRVSIELHKDISLLSIEMQSGDVITIEASEFQIKYDDFVDEEGV